MKYFDYKEHREQGTFNFPIALYHQTPHSPRYYMAYHWHHHYEIIHVLSGTFHLTLDGETICCRAGDIVFIMDGCLHGGSPDSHDCIYDCIVFDLQILMKNNHACSKTIQDIIDHKIVIHTLISECTPVIPHIVNQLTAALSDQKAGYEFMIQGYLYQLLGVILESNFYEKHADNTIMVSQLNSLKAVLAYISENYSDIITLDTLAKKAGMNPNYFCRYFHNMTKHTPIDYLNYYRIECACEMLSKRDISIKDTAVSCGFNDASYFTKIFYKYKGMTPKQFMQMEF